MIIRRLITTLLAMGLAWSYSAHAATFKMATLAPNGSAWMNEIQKAADAIEQQTQGRVKFKFYTGGIMGNSSSVLKKIRVGQLHGGAFTIGDLSEVYPDMQVYTLPFQFRSYAEVDYVRGKMDDTLTQGLARAGMVLLGMSDGGFAYFMSNTSLNGVEALRHKKVWLPEGDQIIQNVYDRIGIASVPLSLADVYTGLQTGMIDTIGSSQIGAIAFQWHTKIKYVSDIPLMYLTGNLVLEQKAFKKISPADQKIVTQVMKTSMDKLSEINRQNDQEAREALKKQGIEYVGISQQDRQRLATVAQQAISNLLDKDAFSKATYQQMEQHLLTYRRQHSTAHARQ